MQKSKSLIFCPSLPKSSSSYQQISFTILRVPIRRRPECILDRHQGSEEQKDSVTQREIKKNAGSHVEDKHSFGRLKRARRALMHASKFITECSAPSWKNDLPLRIYSESRGESMTESKNGIRDYPNSGSLKPEEVTDVQ